MKKLTDGVKVPEIVAKDGAIRCHACKHPMAYNAEPRLWFPESAVHDFTQSLVIMTRQFCCGAYSHTEPVASVSSYLRPVKENARLVCNLMNQYLLAGRPQPQWLTDAWAKWEEKFQRPQSRKLKAS